MTIIFSSTLGDDLERFVSQKRALGFPYDTSERILSVFDRFCLEHYPNERQLGIDLAMHWAQRRPGEHVNTLTRRITPVRQFAKYLLRNCKNITVTKYLPLYASTHGERHCSRAVQLHCLGS